MAKQSFSVGQVLTANQMLSLQQTAMLGGSATAKTASYTLVAADAGTVVSVNSTSATTITVNTGLFSAGDTVTIQNWGSGLVTITAGTATVNTAGSLIVPQYDGGVLYFTSASAAIYFDFVQAGAVSPLTTKGDLYTFGSSDTRLGVGANGTTLVADSSEATGLKWQAPAGGGANWSLLNSGGTSLNGVSTVTVSSISGKDKIVILVIGGSTSSSGGNYAVRFNGDTGSNYIRSVGNNQYASSYSAADHYLDESTTGTSFSIGNGGNAAADKGGFFLQANGCNASGVKVMQFTFAGTGTNSFSNYGGGIYTGSSTISSVTVFSNTGNWDAGTVYVYTSA
jgi:hypothetical protein